MKPIIFVAGMSRAGSMWTYNVIRRLLAAGGYKPIPENIPVDDLVAIQESLSRGPDSDGVFCFKTHRRIDPISPAMRIICPYRDVRDAMYSYMQFMKCPFDRALMAARGMMENTDYYLQRKVSNVLPVRYDEIVGRPEEVIRKIARFLRLDASDLVVDEIAEALSREKMQRYLKELDEIKVNEEHGANVQAQAPRYSSLPRLDGSQRIYDHKTGFQSNHITTGKDGEWRIGLEPQQQKALRDLVGPWLRKYGFPL